MPIFKSYNLTLFCVLCLLMRANLANKIYSLSFKVKMETKKNYEMFEFLTLNTFSYIFGQIGACSCMGQFGKLMLTQWILEGICMPLSQIKFCSP